MGCAVEKSHEGGAKAPRHMRAAPFRLTSLSVAPAGWKARLQCLEDREFQWLGNL
jgi:hypothetical protein